MTKPGQIVDIKVKLAKWEKLIWNIPFNGLGVAGAAGFDAVITGQLKTGQSIGSCLSSDKLLDEGTWENLVIELMDEVISTGRALGHDIPLNSGEYQRNRTRVMGSYRASTLIDFETGRPLELEALFYKPLATAQAKGLEAPRLTKLCSVLNQLVNQSRSTPTIK